MINVKVTTDNGISLPEYKTSGAAGCDVHARSSAVIEPGKWAIVPTGMKVAIPDGYEIQIRPRSGLAMAKGVTVLNSLGTDGDAILLSDESVTVLNSPGTIDSDYRGYIGVMLINHGAIDFVVEVGDRIAQLVLCPVEQIKWEVVDTLDDTDRGSGGFGSTGN